MDGLSIDYLSGQVLGALVGLWFVWHWGLRGNKPSFNFELFLRILVVVTAILACSRVLGVEREVSLRVVMGFPLSLLFLLGIAFSAHSYVGQIVAWALMCLYLGGLLGLGGNTAGAIAQVLIAAFLLLHPIAFGIGGLLNRVQDWNLFFWKKIRAWLNLPQLPPE